MRKIAIIMVIIICAVILTPAYANEDNSEQTLPDSAAYILVESSTGQVLSELNADERLAPASLTKIMLLLLVAEEINAGRLSLDDSVATSVHASEMTGSVIWLEPGEIMSVYDMIKSVVISSANDASVALGEHIANSEENFVKLMNQKAHVLGMTNTNFVNATGLDHPEQYTTARDVATMSRALMREENYAIFAEHMLTRLCSVRTGTDKETQLLNTNNLITFYQGVEGIKTGTTDNAGFCLAAAATQNDMRLISVVMGCKDEYDRVDLSEKLLDYGFANYELYRNTGEDLEPFENLPVTGGFERDLKVVPVLPDAIVIPKGRADDIEYEIYLPEQITAPIARNQPIGTITATLDGELLHESYITAAHTARELTFISVLIFLVRSFFGV